MGQISEDTAKKIAEVWPYSTSLKSAIRSAGLSTKDPRNMNRYRRQSEDILGIKLEPHNAINSTYDDIECPSSLNLSEARKKRDFVVTSHTNNSPLVTEFLITLEKFAKHKKGQLLVVPVRYKNPSVMSSNDDYEWDKRIYPYALLKDINLGKKLVIKAHRITATAANPLQGKQALSGEKSAIYGHPQLALECVGTPKNERPKTMHTTGSCNTARYSATDAGGKAQFHHSVSALYIQLVTINSKPEFHQIQLNWDGEGFYYFDEYWTAEGMTSGHAASAIVHGDIHAEKESKQVTKSKLNLLSIINPEISVFHDLHDHEVGSHHATIRERVEQARSGKFSVKKEVKKSIDYIERLGTKENWIVGANHNDHLDKWLWSYNEKYDPYNSKFAAWLKYKLIDTDNSALQVCFDEFGCKKAYKFLDRNSAHLIHDIDVGQHGDIGVNGARGSDAGYAKTCRKMIKNHSHTIAIKQGCYSGGVSGDIKLFLYAIGLGTWSNSDVIIYANGKRAIVTHWKGKFRR